MNQHRFDTLVRTVAATRNRRRLLHGLAATAVAGVVLRPGVRTVAGQVVTEDSGETCSQDSDCMPAEPDPCTGAFCDAGSCTYTSVACMRGHVCCGNGECCLEGDDDTSPDVTSSEGVAEPGESDEGLPRALEPSDSDCAVIHSSGDE
jgi:hypothetical protein